MKVIFNEAAFTQKVPSLEDASRIYWQFYQTYAALKRAEGITNFNPLYGKRVAITDQVANDGSKISDLQRIWGAQHKGEGRTTFSALLSAFGRVMPIDGGLFPSKLFTIDDISFLIPEDDINSMLLSLATLPKYESITVQGVVNDNSPLELKNISNASHIEEHRIALGIRRYERNPKHKDTYDTIGKGRIASPMDLCDEDAQALLNRAVLIDKDRTLYAALNGKCYVFPEHEPGKAIYHGYLDEHPNEKVQRALGLK